MEIMVMFIRDDASFFYSIEDVRGFSSEVGSRLKGVSMGDFEPEKMPAHSLKVDESMPYQDLMSISHKYGTPIYKSQFEKNLRRGGWYTQPSLMTSMAKALFPAGSETPESYMISIRPERKILAGRPNYTQ